MNSVTDRHRVCATLGCLLCLITLAAGCDDSASDEPVDMSDGPKQQDSDEPTRDRDTVCPDCAPFAPGGETSDFGSELAACTQAYRTRKVTGAEADELGFSVSAIADTMEQPIDAAMTWRAWDSQGGGPARGYAPSTRVRGAIDVRSFTHYWLDEKLCDGTTCTLEDGTQTEQADCPDHYILFTASVRLATDDGAIDVTFPEQPVMLLWPGGDDNVSVAARADLSAVHGSLRIDPGAPEPRLGVLQLSLEFPASGARGVLDVGVYPDWAHRSPDAGSLPREFAYYAPLQGYWGDWPAGSPAAPPVGIPQP